MNKKKLLLAEDDQDDKMLFADLLQDRDDFVLLDSCDNGIELLQYLDEIPDESAFPDLILLDQNMPKMNGSQTLQSLKNTPRYAKIPVAVYTTFPDKNLIAECTQFGAISVVAKPISYTGYLQLMDELSLLIPGQ